VIFDGQENLKSLVTFSGGHFADVHNREYGAFVQDRLIFGPKLQLELGLRYDRERVTGGNDVAPRAGFSFLPSGNARSKLSGGIGLFYDNVPLLNFQLPYLQRRFTTIYSDGVSAEAPAATDVRVDPGLRDPHGLHWNLAWEKEWAPRWVTRVDYIWKRGYADVRLAARTLPGSFDLVFDNSGKSAYHAFEISLDRAIRTNLRFLASYTYSNATARPSLAFDFPDPAVEAVGRTPVDWNTPHRFVGWGYFPLPSGFSASFSVEARSGFPYTVVNDLNRIVSGYNNRHLPAYVVTNASVEKEIPIPLGRGKRIAFRVGVTNLFNRFNPRFVDRNVDSPHFLSLSDSSRRHFSARVRILKK
jgi:outer membrane receptor protein involved in Fe transport